MSDAEPVKAKRKYTRKVAEKLNIKHTDNASDENLAHQIAQQPKSLIAKAVNEAAAELKHVAEVPKAAVYENTPEQVMETIKAIAAKDEFKVNFPGDGTWHFAYKGAEECGNLSIPLRVIKMKAENVAKGARKIKGFRDESGFCMWG
jgi:urease gamma subunit